MPNRAVFITGAAAGIGRATALTFAKNGYTVGGYDIDEVGLKSLADETAALGGTAITGHLDVTDSTEMAQRVGEFAEAAGGRLDSSKESSHRWWSPSCWLRATAWQQIWFGPWWRTGAPADGSRHGLC
jgi:short chain dehydrogenase